MFVLGAVSKGFIERTARNILSTEYCLSPVEAPYCLYLGQFVFDSCGSITYTLVTTIYRYREHLSTRYFNCKLFKNDKSCCSFDDTNKPLNDTEAILRDPERQRYIHINMDASNHFYSIFDNPSWTYDGWKLEGVENVHYQRSKVMGEILERDISQR